MAVKIRLKRMGKIRVPQYRIVVVDSRKKRDGRVIEEIGKYHPKEEPSYIEVVSDRAQYWLGVGAQPTEAVEAILKITGDWQKFKGLPGTEGTLQGRRAQARQARDLQRGPQGRRQRAQGRRGDQEGRQEGREAGRGGDRRGAKAEEPKADEAAAEEPAAEEPAEAAEETPAEVPAVRDPGRRCRRGRGRRDGTAEAAGKSRGLSTMLAEALEHLVRGVVDHPDDVTVRDKQLRRGSILEVRVHPDDLGKVIGRGGRTATAFRTVISALAGRGGARIDFVDVDRRR